MSSEAVLPYGVEWSVVLPMTMILTCLTREYVVQVSDRRLSRLEGKSIRTVEDHSNKALIYSTYFAFAYTGLAKLPFTPAIDWAAQHLSEKQSLQEAAVHLENRASDLMRSNPIMRNLYARYPEARRLEFVGAGFADIENDRVKWSRAALRIVISNYRGEDGTWLPQPRPAFRVAFDPLPLDREFDLFVSGQPLPGNRKARVNKLLAKCLQVNAKPETVARLLTREIQATSGRNPTVGRNVMCVMIPRAYRDEPNRLIYRAGGILMENPRISPVPQQIEPVKMVPDQFRFAIPPPFDTPVFVYAAGDNSALPYHGPLLVGPGTIMPSMHFAEMSLTIPAVKLISDSPAG